MKRSSIIDEFILDLTKYPQTGTLPLAVATDIRRAKYSFLKVLYDGETKLVPVFIYSQDGDNPNVYIYSNCIGLDDDIYGIIVSINMNTGVYEITEG